MNATDRKAVARIAKVMAQCAAALDAVLERNGGKPTSLARRKAYQRGPRKGSKRQAKPQQPVVNFWPDSPEASIELPPRALDPFNPKYES